MIDKSSIDAMTEHFYKNEPVGSARKFAHLIGLKDKSKETDFVLGYTYARQIDDLIDSGENPVLAEKIILEQENTLREIIERGGICPNNTDTEILSRLFASYGNAIVESYLDLMIGFEIDNYIISTGKPVSQNVLDIRHISQNISSFNLMNIVSTGSKLKYSRNFEELIKSWATYDALIDFKEDLSSGLILFSAEELEENGIEFRNHQPLPEGFQKFLYDKRKKVTRELIERSYAVNETSLSFLEKKALKIYFLSRTIKLAKKDLSITEDMLYHTHSELYDAQEPVMRESYSKHI